MIEPRYTYKVAGPCFTIETEQPAVLKGCSCGWPSNACKKWNGLTVTDRERAYAVSIEFQNATL